MKFVTVEFEGAFQRIPSGKIFKIEPNGKNSCYLVMKNGNRHSIKESADRLLQDMTSHKMSFIRFDDAEGGFSLNVNCLDFLAIGQKSKVYVGYSDDAESYQVQLLAPPNYMWGTETVESLVDFGAFGKLNGERLRSLYINPDAVESVVECTEHRISTTVREVSFQIDVTLAEFERHIKEGPVRLPSFKGPAAPMAVHKLKV